MTDDWLSITLRVALYLSMTTSFGVALFAVSALRDDERDSQIARRYSMYVAWAALAGIVLSLWSMTVIAKTMSGTASYGELSSHIFEMLLTGTHMGRAWCVRILALSICMLTAVFISRSTVRFIILAITSGAAVATLAWTGHGAMDDGLLGLIHLGIDIAHLWAAAAWAGALIAFVMLSSTKSNLASGATEILSRTSNSFARFGTVIVVTLTVTGILNYLMIQGASLEPLYTTLYGRLLLGKFVLFAGMLALAAANRYRLSPRLASSLAAGDSIQAAAALRMSLIRETSLAVLVFVSVAWLGVLSPKAL